MSVRKNPVASAGARRERDWDLSREMRELRRRWPTEEGEQRKRTLERMRAARAEQQAIQRARRKFDGHKGGMLRRDPAFAAVRAQFAGMRRVHRTTHAEAQRIAVLVGPPPAARTAAPQRIGRNAPRPRTARQRHGSPAKSQAPPSDPDPEPDAGVAGPSGSAGAARRPRHYSSRPPHGVRLDTREARPFRVIGEIREAREVLLAVADRLVVVL